MARGPSPGLGPEWVTAILRVTRSARALRRPGLPTTPASPIESSWDISPLRPGRLSSLASPPMTAATAMVRCPPQKETPFCSPVQVRPAHCYPLQLPWAGAWCSSLRPPGMPTLPKAVATRRAARGCAASERGWTIATTACMRAQRMRHRVESSRVESIATATATVPRGEARRGEARRGEAKRGEAGRGEQGRAGQGQGRAGQGKAPSGRGGRLECGGGGSRDGAGCGGSVHSEGVG